MFLTKHDNSVIPVLLEGFNLLPLSWNRKWSNVPIIQIPDKIQLKHRLNISQQNQYIIHVISGNKAMYLFNIIFLPGDLLLITCQEIHWSIAKSSPHDLSLITCLETTKCWYLWKRKKICLYAGTENNVLKRIRLEYSCEAGSYFPYSIVFLINRHFIGTAGI